MRKPIRGTRTQRLFVAKRKTKRRQRRMSFMSFVIIALLIFGTIGTALATGEPGASEPVEVAVQGEEVAEVAPPPEQVAPEPVPDPQPEPAVPEPAPDPQQETVENTEPQNDSQPTAEEGQEVIDVPSDGTEDAVELPEQTVPALGVAVDRMRYANESDTAFVTNAENTDKLSIVGQYTVTDEAAVTGTTVTMHLQNVGANYFALPDNNIEGIVTLPAGASNLTITAPQAMDASENPVYDADGRPVYDILIGFLLNEGAPSGEVRVDVPYDKELKPADGTHIARATMTTGRDGLYSSQYMEVFSKEQPMLMMTPLALNPIVDIDSIISTNAAAFMTNSTNATPLVVVGKFVVEDAGGSDGTTVKFKLSNVDRNYFTLPAQSNVQFPTSIQSDVSNLQITEVANSTGAKDIIVSFDLDNLAQYTEAEVTVNFPFDHDTFDGWIAKGTNLATVEMGAQKGNDTSTLSTQSLNVISDTINSRGGERFEKTPTANTGLDMENNIRATFSNYFQDRWRYEPGTEVKVVLEYPVGAVITPGSTDSTADTNKEGTDDSATGTVTWTLGTADSEGRLTTGLSNYIHDDGGYWRMQSLMITFPSAEFALDDQLELRMYAEYTLAGMTAPTKNKAPQISFEIESMDIHMQPGTFVSGNSFCPVVNADTLQNSRMNTNINNGANYQGITNAGGKPIPDTNFEWVNDTGANKARPHSVRVYNYGSTFNSEIVAYLKDSSGADAGMKTFNVNAASNVGTYTTVNLTIPAGQYIDRFEIYPLDSSSGTPERALPLGAGMGVIMSYQSWPNGTFPNGTAINHNDISAITTKLSWKGETKPEEFTGLSTNGTGVDTVYTLVNANATQSVIYGKDAPAPLVWYSLSGNEGATQVPGSSFTANINFKNYSLYWGVSDWKNPVFMVYLPDMLEIDEMQTPEVFSPDGASLGNATLERVSAGVYKLKLPPGTTVPLSNMDAANVDVYTTSLQFTVKAGATPGSYYLAGTNGAAGYPTTSGILIGTSAMPNNLIYPQGVAGNSRFFVDGGNYDNYAGTSYLFNVRQNTTFTITESRSLKAYATMLNNNIDGQGNEGWQNISNPAAQATVKLEETGQYRLEVLNEGNSYVGDVQLLDVLPQTGVAGSQWDAFLQSLDVKMYNANGAEVSGFSNADYTLQYSTQGDPEYNSNGLTRNGTGGAFASDTTDLSVTKSFLFKLNPGCRMEPGGKIVITGTIKAPATATTASIGQAAYNEFMCNANYYTNATGNTGLQASNAIKPNDQKFILMDNGTAKFTKSAFAFRDLNGNGVYDSGVDEKLPGMAVGLYVYSTDVDTQKGASTDANGQYEFEELGGGDYYMLFDLPTYTKAFPNGADVGYSFVTKGMSNTSSHVNPADGKSDQVSVNAGQSTAATVNAGVSAKGLVRVIFKTDGGAQVGNAIDQYYTNLTNSFGTITPGTTTGFDLPAGYVIKSGTDAYKTFNINWTNLYEELTFTVEEELYSVSYHYNYGSSAADLNREYTNYRQDNLTPGSKVSSPGTPTLDGYEFAGWYTSTVPANPDDTGKWDFANDAVTADVKLYAGWTKVHTITFHGNGGTPATATATVKNGEKMGAAVIAANEPTRDHYTFDKWTRNADGSGGTFNDNTAITGDINVYAQWNGKTYRVTFDENGGNAPLFVSKYEDVTYPVNKLTAADIDKHKPAMGGHTFGGWKSSASDTFNENYVITGDMTVTAQWNATSITGGKVFQDYDHSKTQNGSEPGYGGLNVALYKDSNVSGTSLTGNGEQVVQTAADGSYAFTGVEDGDYRIVLLAIPQTGGYANSVASGMSAVSDKITIANGISVNAGFVVPIWAQNKLTVNYILNDTANTNVGNYSQTDYFQVGATNTWGEAANHVPSGYVAVSSTTTSYRFNDWNTREQVTTFIVKDPNEGRVYTIIFDGNGADVQASPAVMTVTYPATNIQQLPTQPSRTGYTFNGWNTSANGSGTKFNANNTVSGNMTVYAQWEANYYNMSFDLNGGSGAVPQTQSVLFGQKVAAVSNPSRTNYTFRHWNTARDGSGMQWNFGSHTMPANNATLYAQWDTASITPPAPVVTPTPSNPNPGTNPTPVPANPNPPPAPVNPTPTSSADATPTSSPEVAAIVTPPPTDSSNGGGSSTTETTEETTTEVSELTDPITIGQAIKDAGVPTVTIGENEVPLYGIPNVAVWAIMNLILAIVGIALAVVMLVAAVIRQRGGRKESEYSFKNVVSRQTNTRVFRPLPLILTVIMGIISLLVFVLTQDMGNYMVMVDNWTILMSGLIAVEIVAAFFTTRRKNHKSLDDPDIGMYPDNA